MTVSPEYTGDEMSEALYRPKGNISNMGYSEGGIPIFRPTMDEFTDFEAYVKKLEPYGMETGIVKVIPPKEWVESLSKLDEAVKTVKIKNPIMQDVNGTGGLYKLQNIEKQRTYNIVEWRELCEETVHQPPARRGERRNGARPAKRRRQAELNQGFEGFDYRYNAAEFTEERCEDLERTYWKSITYASPMYGADMPGSLFQDSCKTWNVARLDNILNNLKYQIPGVNTAYLYCGMWKSTFAWHLEDMDLFSINYIHFGAPKQWYSISQKDRHKFFNVMKDLFSDEYKNCKEFLRHKTFHASPALLQQMGVNVNKVVHYQNEFMITFPYGYHSGFNFGYNVAESVNFATESWIPFGKVSKKCQCISDSVGIDVNQLERHLKGEYSDDEMMDSIKSLPTPPPSASGDILVRGRMRMIPAKKPIVKKQPRKVIRKVNGWKLNIECELCPNKFDPDLVASKDGKVTAHRICAEYIHETSIDSSGVLIGVRDIPKSRKDLKCLYCGSPKGACFQCSEPKCTRSYHATCAGPAGVLAMSDENSREQRYFLCRFHRPKRPSLDALEEDKFTMDWAFTLLPDEVVQCQIGTGDIFAGIVEENLLDEEAVRIRVLPDCSDRMEVEWKWVRNPGKLDIGPMSYAAVPSNKPYKQHKEKSLGMKLMEEKERQVRKKRKCDSNDGSVATPESSEKKRKITNHEKGKIKLIRGCMTTSDGERIILTGIKDDKITAIVDEETDADRIWAIEVLTTVARDEPSSYQCGEFHVYNPLISTMTADKYEVV